LAKAGKDALAYLDVDVVINHEARGLADEIVEHI